MNIGGLVGRRVRGFVGHFGRGAGDRNQEHGFGVRIRIGRARGGEPDVGGPSSPHKLTGRGRGSRGFAPLSSTGHDDE